MTCSPCPFCGVTLEPYRDRAGAPVTYAHPLDNLFDSPCFMRGHSIGAALMPRWNKRAGVKMTLATDEAGVQYPVFGDKGEPVSLGMINDTIAWYKSKAND